jgi:hypothetical protein
MRTGVMRMAHPTNETAKTKKGGLSASFFFTAN